MIGSCRTADHQIILAVISGGMVTARGHATERWKGLTLLPAPGVSQQPTGPHVASQR